MTRTNPIGDTLNASWLGAAKNPKLPKRDEPVSTYMEQDAHHYFLLALYGPQEPPQRSRRN